MTDAQGGAVPPQDPAPAGAPTREPPAAPDPAALEEAFRCARQASLPGPVEVALDSVDLIAGLPGFERFPELVELYSDSLVTLGPRCRSARQVRELFDRLRGLAPEHHRDRHRLMVKELALQAPTFRMAVSYALILADTPRFVEDPVEQSDFARLLCNCSVDPSGKDVRPLEEVDELLQLLVRIPGLNDNEEVQFQLARTLSNAAVAAPDPGSAMARASPIARLPAYASSPPIREAHARALANVAAKSETAIQAAMIADQIEAIPGFMTEEVLQDQAARALMAAVALSTDPETADGYLRDIACLPHFRESETLQRRYVEARDRRLG